MTAAAKPFEVTEPGIVYDLPNETYQADPVAGGSLSSSGARRLLPPSCPAIFRYEADHGRPDKQVYDVGHAAHDRLLGGGPEIVRVDAKDWRTKASKEAAADARARGAVPLLAHELAEVDEMVAAVRAHPFAGNLFEDGAPEVSLFARDTETGVMLRGRLDWLPNPRNGRMIIADLKTARSANPTEFAKAVASYGYFMQADWYSNLVRRLGLADDLVFLFVVVESTPPYVVSVVQLDTIALRIGAARNRQAIDLYAECAATDRWPGYVQDVALVSLPIWAERQFEDDLNLSEGNAP